MSDAIVATNMNVVTVMKWLARWRGWRPMRSYELVNVTHEAGYHYCEWHRVDIVGHTTAECGASLAHRYHGLPRCRRRHGLLVGIINGEWSLLVGHWR